MLTFHLTLTNANLCTTRVLDKAQKTSLRPPSLCNAMQTTTIRISPRHFAQTCLNHELRGIDSLPIEKGAPQQSTACGQLFGFIFFCTTTLSLTFRSWSKKVILAVEWSKSRIVLPARTMLQLCIGVLRSTPVLGFVLHTAGKRLVSSVTPDGGKR